jgi:hypothetical protein
MIDLTISTFRVLQTPVTSAPKPPASCTAKVPTPAATPLISTFWPARTCPLSRRARLPARVAQAEHIEAVAVGLEALRLGELRNGTGYLLLQARRERDVDDLSAVYAEQMMVVLGEVFGQLVPGELVVCGDPPDEPGRVQVGQVPVGGTAWQVRQALGDVADTHRVARADEQVNDGAPSCGVPLVDQAQAAFSHAVHVVNHLRA